MASSPSPRPRRIVGTSLKMYFDLPSTLAYIRGITVANLPALAATHDVDLFVIPDFVTLLEARRLLLEQDTPVVLGAQDCFWEARGAYTGEVSPRTLKQAGVGLVELGHAERRRLFGEGDEQVARKAMAAVAEGLVPLVCVGERTQGEVGVAVEECRAQVESVLAAVPEGAEVILAYEPVWAIGAEKPADAEHVVGVTRELRKMAGTRKGTTRILYGGSAGPGTFAKLVDGVDGLFLGRFAHDLANLKQVITEVGES